MISREMDRVLIGLAKIETGLSRVHEAKTHLSKLLTRVAAGEEIVISKAGKPIGRLVPWKQNVNQRKILLHNIMDRLCPCHKGPIPYSPSPKKGVLARSRNPTSYFRQKNVWLFDLPCGEWHCRYQIVFWVPCVWLQLDQSV
jgi:prevent-host-death family protein